MGLESVYKSNLYREAHERRRVEREQVLMFAGYLDSLPGEVQDDIKDTAWRIASETVDAADTEDGWYGGSSFKKTLERMRKRYLSGFDRDVDSLFGQGIKSAGDRAVAEQAIASAERELSRFSELEFVASEDDESSGEESEREAEAESHETDAVNAESAAMALANESDEIDTEPVLMRRKTFAGDLSAVDRHRQMKETDERRQQENAERTAERERLNQELRTIQEEMREWEVGTPFQYEQAVDFLVRGQGLSPEDAMKLVNGINTMSQWRTARTIRDVRRSYFLETKEPPTKERGRGFSR